MKTISQRLSSLREEAGINQVELAKRVGCSNSTISRIENGYRLPTPAMVNRILKFYKALFNWNDEEYRKKSTEFDECFTNCATTSSQNASFDEILSSYKPKVYSTGSEILTDLIAIVKSSGDNKIVIEAMGSSGGTIITSIIPAVVKATTNQLIQIHLFLINPESPSSAWFPSHWIPESKLIVERAKKEFINDRIYIKIYTYDHLPVISGIMVNKKHLFLGCFRWTQISDRLELRSGEISHLYFNNRNEPTSEFFFDVFESWSEGNPYKNLVYEHPNNVT